ncbi:hypothetical protein ABFS82_02G071400 [Erythranthe guttata]
MLRWHSLWCSRSALRMSMWGPPLPTNRRLLGSEAAWCRGWFAANDHGASAAASWWCEAGCCGWWGCEAGCCGWWGCKVGCCCWSGCEAVVVVIVGGGWRRSGGVAEFPLRLSGGSCGGSRRQHRAWPRGTRWWCR